MPPVGAEEIVKRKLPPLGAHVSVAGGVHTAPERGKRIGAEVIQIFSKHGTRWAGKALGEDDIRAFREEGARTGVRTVAIHCAYLINLGSSRRRSARGRSTRSRTRRPGPRCSGCPTW